MGGRKADEFARSNDLGLFPECREMLLVAGNQVIRTGFVGAFQKGVVVGIAAHVQAALWCDDMAAVLDELEQLQTPE